MLFMKKYLSIVFSFLFLCASSQTLVMNEVSNGPSGNMEYVEFVVADTTVVYNCTAVTTPPCIDIRGWIFDDNSGYHGASGVAAGCIRFSNDPFWSCMPVGTIILIYNNGDPNSSLPPDDLSMADGNCRLVIPVNDATLFEQNATTPGAVACSYPGAGWNPSGNWATTLLANGGDCARIVNLAGCEVFSVCWGSANTNTLIYFSGSAQDRVYFFNNSSSNTASNVINWTSACADVAACGSNSQTPGAPNNVANANWINSMNNNCTPIQPMSVSSSTIMGPCPCTASASVNPSGSLPPFTYTWSPAPGSGQGTQNAGGLCTGAYTCFVQSSTTKCIETVIVNVTNGNSFTATATGNGPYCEGETIQLGAVSGTGYLWNGPGSFTSSVQNPTLAATSTTLSGTYTVIVSVGACTALATTSITVNASPTATVSNNGPLCEGNTLVLDGGSGSGYMWMGPTGFTSTAQSPTITNSSISNGGSYTLVVTGANSCTRNAVTNVVIDSAPNVIANASGACFGGVISFTASGGNTYLWSGPGGFTSPLQNPSISNATITNSGIYTVVATSSNNCSNSTTINVNVQAMPVATISGTNVCAGATLSLTAGGGSNYLWSGPNSFSSTNQNISIAPASVNDNGSYSVIVSNGACSNSTAINITVFPLPNIVASSNGNNLCVDSMCVFNASGGANYSWSGPAGFNASIANPTIQKLSESNEGIYYVSTTSAEGCAATASIVIIVDLCRCTPFIPEGFSPNNDGVHDNFFITCIEGRKTTVEIYNRWGNLVFKDEDYKNNWSGKLNSGLQVSGDDLPTGTYYYIVKVEDEDKARTGFLTLWR